MLNKFPWAMFGLTIVGCTARHADADVREDDLCAVRGDLGGRISGAELALTYRPDGPLPSDDAVNLLSFVTLHGRAEDAFCMNYFEVELFLGDVGEPFDSYAISGTMTVVGPSTPDQCTQIQFRDQLSAIDDAFIGTVFTFGMGAGIEGGDTMPEGGSASLAGAVSSTFDQEVEISPYQAGANSPDLANLGPVDLEPFVDERGVARAGDYYVDSGWTCPRDGGDTGG